MFVCFSCDKYDPDNVDKCKPCYFYHVRARIQEEPWEQQNDDGMIEIEVSL